MNPSFEDTISCSIYAGPPQMQCTNWFWPHGGSPDYFSEQYLCSSSPAPSNFLGFQFARTGIAYTGISVYVEPWFTFPNYREYIEGILIDTLKHGHQYCVSFYVSAADDCKFVIDALGAYLSTDSLIDNFSDTVLFNYNPQINNPAGNIISDTLNWTLISGIYSAQGGEKFITIGNFKIQANTVVDSLNNNAPLGNWDAYYYIDDVSVVDCTVGINEINENVNANIYPNPFADKLNITTNNKELSEITLYDIYGRIILTQLLTPNSELNTQNLPQGIYLYEIKNKEGVIKKGKVVKL